MAAGAIAGASATDFTAIAAGAASKPPATPWATIRRQQQIAKYCKIKNTMYEILQSTSTLCADALVYNLMSVNLVQIFMSCLYVLSLCYCTDNTHV